MTDAGAQAPDGEAIEELARQIAVRLASHALWDLGEVGRTCTEACATPGNGSSRTRDFRRRFASRQATTSQRACGCCGIGRT